jgi:hypothetical protein
MFYSKETDRALMCDDAWKSMGAEPFEDNNELKAEELAMPSEAAVTAVL